MTDKEAWEAIFYRHCEDTCDYDYTDCQQDKCEYYMALNALNFYHNYKQHQTEVVRCKDCIHYESMICGITNMVGDDDDFCSYGERSE